MKNRKSRHLYSLTGVAGLLLVLTLSTAQAESEYLGDVAGWQLLYLPDFPLPERGGEDGCGAAALYGEKTISLDLIGRRGTWVFSITQEGGWSGIQADQEYFVTFVLDNGSTGSVMREKANGLVDGLRVVGLAPGFIDDFARYNVLKLSVADEPLGRFDLDGTGKMTEAVKKCHQERILAKDSTQLVPQELQDKLDSLIIQVGKLSEQGETSKAIALAQESLALADASLGKEHVGALNNIDWLAHLYQSESRGGKAEPLYQRALAIREKALGPEHPDVATSLNNLAALYDSQGRYAEAEPLYQRALAIYEQALGPENPDVATSLNNLALLYNSQGRYAEAEPFYQRALAIREKALGPEHPDVATSLNNLAVLYGSQMRYAEAEPFYQRALAIREKALGPEHPDVATSLNNLAALYDSQGRYAEAEPLYQRALAIREQALGPENPDVATSLANLANLYESQGRYAEAEPLHQRALAIYEQALGPENPDVATSLNNLALLYNSQGRYAEAEPLYQRALAIWEQALGPEHPDVATSLNNLAWLNQNQGKIAKALPLRHRAQVIDAERLRKGLTGKTGEGQTDQRDRSLAYLPLLAELKTPTTQDQADRLLAIQLARRADSAEAFQALAQRLAAGGRGELADLVRQRQDLLAQLQDAEKGLLDSYSLPAEQRSEELTKNLRSQIDRLDEQERELSERLQRDFPAYTEFEGTQLTDLAALQQALKPGEAAIAWVLDKDAVYRLIVRHDGEPKLETVPATANDIRASVEQLHQALDLDADRHFGQPVDFPAAAAYQLFAQLFGPDWSSELQDINHLLLVPEGILTRLPFAALLTEEPSAKEFPARGEHYQVAPWLVDRFAISILPSLSAITSLRGQTAAAPADQPFLGIGDPLLDDHPAKFRGGEPAKPQQVTLARNVRGLKRLQESLSPQDLRNSRLKLIHQLPALPDTADELHAIARLFGQNTDLLLRESATESELKQQPLGNYNILSFATHGVLAGELGRGIEPGLILTPPATATEQDDGFLSLSEVAQLKLNSDWVVLSACNTAGGGEQQEAEGFTGLAKAFIYAGAKSLLVSHWSISSQGTVALMTRLFDAYQGQQISRAQAHRKAMREMITSGDPQLRHPSIWAPFVVVGDGG